MNVLLRYALAGVSGVALAGAAVAAPVSIDSLSRSVHVAIPSIEPGEPAVDETNSSTSTAADTPVPVLDRTLNQMGQTNRASALIDTDVSNATAGSFEAFARGESRYGATGVSGIVFAESNFELTFTLFETRSYTLFGAGSFVDTSGGASNFNVILTGPEGTVASFSKAVFDPGNNDGAVVTPTFGAAGTLAPGAYTLSGVAGVSGGTNSNEIQATFQVDFTATAPDDGGGNPIPLPVAAGPAGVLLLGLAGRAVQRTRRAR